jgi:hypothetical protein
MARCPFENYFQGKEWVRMKDIYQLINGGVGETVQGIGSIKCNVSFIIPLFIHDVRLGLVGIVYLIGQLLSLESGIERYDDGPH